MFNIFKRTKVAEWEIELICNILESAPIDYALLIKPIKEGLFRGIMLEASDIPGYNAFKLNSSILKKYEKRRENSYKLSGIKVFDDKSGNFLNYAICVSSGVVTGYILQGPKKFKIDPNKFDASLLKQEEFENSDYKEIEDILSSDEKELINPSTVYVVELKGEKYFNISDLEDGDFIGIDINKKVFEISHDPFEITEITNKTLLEILQGK